MKTFFVSIPFVQFLWQGTADAEIKVLYVENPEQAKILPLKPRVNQNIDLGVLCIGLPVISGLSG